MFGNKKETSKGKTKKQNQNSGIGINSLVEGTTVKGELFTASDIRIDGTITGNIECKGKLILGATGKVDGDIHCQNAVILGSIKGKLKVDVLLEVKDSAVIDGDVFTDQLNVDSGAIFNVNCIMGGKKVKTVKEEK